MTKLSNPPSVYTPACIHRDDDNQTVFLRSNCNDTTEILQIAPIPQFLIYDGFEKDLDAEEVPSFSAVLKYCGKTVDEVYPLIDRKCAPNDIFGKCYLGKKLPCDHRLLNDS